VCKIDRTCCAFMSVCVENHSGSVAVEYCDHHVGHSLDIGHLRLSAELRLEVAGLLHQGVTVSKVMDSIRDRVGGSVQRDLLLCRCAHIYFFCTVICTATCWQHKFKKFNLQS